MTASAREMPIAEHGAKVSLPPAGRWRLSGITRTRNLAVAAFALAAVAGSAVWFMLGGWWWLPFCIVMSTVSVIAVLQVVYAGSAQRRAIHHRLRPVDASPTAPSVRSS